MKYLSKVSFAQLKGVALLRLDFNTEDEWRMKATLQTIQFLLTRGVKVIILSHRGRPRGFERRLSLKKDAKNLAKFLRRRVRFIPHFHFSEIQRTVADAPKNSVFLLENLRFLKGEEKNDKKLARRLSSLGDFYVNDAFAVSHRADASVVAITKFVPSYAGLKLEKEITFLSHVLGRPKKPFVIVLGGGKAHDKLGVLKYFKSKANYFLLGGAPANTLLFLRGVDVKQSLRDRDPRDIRNLRAVLTYSNVFLPVDYRFHSKKILDIGPKTIALFRKKIKRARTIVWSGPIGLFEEKGYDTGTLAVARAIAANRKAFSLAGGGETVMFLKKHRLDKKFSFISTGGGAMLDFLAGETLAGIIALEHGK